MKRFSCLFVAVLLTTGCAGSRARLQKAATSEDEIVEAEGTAPYKADDLPGTKAASLAAAQRSAVELVVGVYVNAKTRVEKAVAIEQSILTQAQGYVKKYDILSEGRSGEWYKTRIRALVSTKSVHKDLDSLGLLRQPDVGNPRATLLLTEWIGEQQDTTHRTSRALTQALLDRGFQVVDFPAMLHNDQDPVDVARSLKREQADLLIAGIARTQSLGYSSRELGGMASYRASITLRVLEVGSGEVVSTVSETASGLDATPDLAAGKSFENAGKLAGADLASLPQELAKRSHVDLTINGLTSFATLADFQKSLASQIGVKDFFLRSFSQVSGVAVFDVKIEGISPQELAGRCVQWGGESWSVQQVLGHSIQLSASPAGR